jgi:probable F420-dependent oxidoreductase
MKIGVVFPQLDIGVDVGAIRHFASSVAELGADHIIAYDHVVGADRQTYAGMSKAYWQDSTFHEPFVLFGFLAAISDLELMTSVLVLPQRPAVLVAKQAAEVDILTGGRLRLGVGVGWNDVEYVSLGQSFSDRGKRIEDQIAVMRRLWTEESIDLDSEYHRLPSVGIAPLPIQRPIPIWIGARPGTPAIERIGRIADGWTSFAEPGPDFDATLVAIRDSAMRAGRDPASIGLECLVRCGSRDLDTITSHVNSFRSAGAGYLALDTMKSGLKTLDDHLAAVEEAITVIRASEAAS